MDSYHQNNNNSKTAMFFILFAGIALSLVYFLCIRKPRNQRNSLLSEPSEIRMNRQAYSDNQCCICLTDPKVLEVSTTCGHSFCGKCILDIHDHSNQKINCPLCRKEINVFFKVFRDREPRDTIQNMQGRIRGYNRKFNTDTRSMWRKFTEFPYILRISRSIFGTDFIRFFFSGGNISRMVFTIVGYWLSPIDLIPQALIGPAGYLDDCVMPFIIVGYTVANSVVQYVRERGQQ